MLKHLEVSARRLFHPTSQSKKSFLILFQRSLKCHLTLVGSANKIEYKIREEDFVGITLFVLPEVRGLKFVTSVRGGGVSLGEEGVL